MIEKTLANSVRIPKPCLRRILSAALFLPMLFLMLGCSKSEKEPVWKENPSYLSNNKLVVKDIVGVPSDVEIDKIEISINGFEWEIIAVIEAPYVNGKAVLELPRSFPSEKLCKVSRSDAFDYTGFWPALADNLDARVAGFENIYAYSGEKRVGRVYPTDWSGTGSQLGKYYIAYHFTNKPYSLSGYNYTVNGNSHSFLYDLNFKKGWNAFAKINNEDDPADWTTTIPEDLATQWRFE